MNLLFPCHNFQIFLWTSCYYSGSSSYYRQCHIRLIPHFFTITILSLLCCLLPQASSPWYFSWNNGDPHRSGFNFQTAVLSVLCVRLSFVVNPSNVYWRGLQIFFKTLITTPVAPVITGIITHFMFYIRCIPIRKPYYLLYFMPPFVWQFSPLLLPHLSVCVFTLSCF